MSLTVTAGIFKTPEALIQYKDSTLKATIRILDASSWGNVYSKSV
jgi:hypothetical protein